MHIQIFQKIISINKVLAIPAQESVFQPHEFFLSWHISTLLTLQASTWEGQKQANSAGSLDSKSKLLVEF